MKHITISRLVESSRFEDLSAEFSVQWPVENADRDVTLASVTLDRERAVVPDVGADPLCGWVVRKLHKDYKPSTEAECLQKVDRYLAEHRADIIEEANRKARKPE